MFQIQVLGAIAFLISGLFLSQAAFARTSIKVMSFNTWLLEAPQASILPQGLAKKITAEHLQERLKIIPEKVAKAQADIIALQEVWSEERRKALAEEFKKLGYPYSCHHADPNAERVSVGKSISRSWGFKFAAGALRGWLNTEEGQLGRKDFGHGLLLVSKYEIASDPKQMQFSQATQVEELLSMKGGVLSQIKLPEIGWTNFVNTHLGARSYSSKLKKYEPIHTRVNKRQLEELIHWIGKNQSPEDTKKSNSGLLFVAGDLNLNHHMIENDEWTENLSEAYQLLVGEEEGSLGLIDTYRKVHGFSDPPAFTDEPKNLYAAKRYEEGQPGEVIDYILVSDSEKIQIIKSKILFGDPLPQSSDSPMPSHLSDHSAVLTEMILG